MERPGPHGNGNGRGNGSGPDGGPLRLRPLTMSDIGAPEPRRRALPPGPLDLWSGDARLWSPVRRIAANVALYFAVTFAAVCIVGYPAALVALLTGVDLGVSLGDINLLGVLIGPPIAAAYVTLLAAFVLPIAYLPLLVAVELLARRVRAPFVRLPAMIVAALPPLVAFAVSGLAPQLLLLLPAAAFFALHLRLPRGPRES